MCLSSHIIYQSVSRSLFTTIPSSAPYLARFKCYFTPRHNPFPHPKRCRVPPVQFRSPLVRSSRGFIHLSTSRVLHSVTLSDFLWQQMGSLRSQIKCLSLQVHLLKSFLCIHRKEISGDGRSATPLITSHRPCRLCVAFHHKSRRRFPVHLLTKVSRFESARTFDRESLVHRTFLSRTASHWDSVSPSRMRRAIVKVKCDTMITTTPPTITTRSPILLASPRATIASDLSVK